MPYSQVHPRPIRHTPAKHLSRLKQKPCILAGADILQASNGCSLVIEGFATWDISANHEPNSPCNVDRVKETPSGKVSIGEVTPRTCRLSNEALSEWPGLRSGPKSSRNYLALFVLSWSCIVSKCLIELRRRTSADLAIYTDTMATLVTATERWRATILAPGRG